MTGVAMLLRRSVAALALAWVAAVPAARAADADILPPRSEWRASASSIQTPALAPAHAIDGDPATRWGGAFTPEHWFQLDLGRVARIGGVLLHWDSGFAARYRILSSVDGQQWHTAFETEDGQGGHDPVFFPAVAARYLRLASVPRTADWGVSVFEFEPLAAAQAPRLAGLAPAGPRRLAGLARAADDPAWLWREQPRQARALAGHGGRRELLITLPRPLATAGLAVDWAAPRRRATLEWRDAQGRWQPLAADPQGQGTTSYLAARQPVTAHALRLRVEAAGTPALHRLRLLSPEQVMTPYKRYEIAASRQHRALFPPELQREQTYWTAVGLPAGRHKSALDELGNLEAFKGAPMVQPVWRDAASGRAVAADKERMTHALREGWMPMPSASWSPQPGLVLRTEAIAVEQAGAPVTLWRHRLTNTGRHPLRGQLALLVRPAQVNPAWQNGGHSAIDQIAVEGPPEATAVRVNGRVLLHSLSPVAAGGAAPFGEHGQTEITRFAAAGTVPAATAAHDGDGLAAALLRYAVRLAPGASRDVVLAFPLGHAPIDIVAGRAKAPLPPAPEIDRAALMASQAEAGAAFEHHAAQVAAGWRQRIERVGLRLPDASLVHMLRAQLAYMLINQTGPAMQPGPRNYNRSFIRDGSASAIVLARLGLPTVARDYLRWYARHALHPNGLVSPILNDDGSVNTGFGSDLEHDSQGQFVNLVAELARRDPGGAAALREYQPKVTLALRFLQQLRERTLVPGYAAEREAPQRFAGLVAPSISHEGYSTPTHSYWDDYWALKGWHDGAWLAEQWGDAGTAAWARQQYAALRASLAASIRATMAWKGIAYVPSSADLGDPDPTSVSIGLDPTGQQDVMPPEALQRTFADYLADVRRRHQPDGLWAYTPYEMRNVLTYVHLNQPEAAHELLASLLRDRRPAPWQVLAEVVHSRLRHPGYLGDMPHTWVGAEYVRAVLGLLLHEADDHLRLLPGTPPAWLAGEGLALAGLPTAFGPLTMTARQQGQELRVTLAEGLRADAAVQLAWPTRQRPQQVWVDGQAHSDFTAEGVRLARPFKELVARW